MKNIETFVRGNLPPNEPVAGAVKSRLENLGYRMEGDGFSKPGKIEQVIIELVPVWEWLGLDAKGMELAEFNPGLDKPTAIYEDGRINRAN